MSSTWDCLLGEIVHEIIDTHAVPQWCGKLKRSGEQAPFDAYTIPAGPGVWQTVVAGVQDLVRNLVHAVSCRLQQPKDRLET